MYIGYIKALVYILMIEEQFFQDSFVKLEKITSEPCITFSPFIICTGREDTEVLQQSSWQSCAVDTVGDGHRKYFVRMFQ